jgi:hypothetical protein
MYQLPPTAEISFMKTIDVIQVPNWIRSMNAGNEIPVPKPLLSTRTYLFGATAMSMEIKYA